MHLLQLLFFFLLTLGILVSIHEYGHFVVARASGVKVLRFAIGFGRPILRRQWRDDTEFVIGAIPLGGYVRMLDEREGPVAPADASRSFNRLSPWWRIGIAVAGPAANLLLAVAAYWIVFMVGIKDVPAVLATPVAGSPLAQAGVTAGSQVIAIDGKAIGGVIDLARELSDHLGESGALAIQLARIDGKQETRTLQLRDWLKGAKDPDLLGSLGFALGYRVGEVRTGSAAERAGLRSGDAIASIDGQAVPTWREFHERVRAAPGRVLQVQVQRDGAPVLLQLTPSREREADGTEFGLAGIAQRYIEVSHGPFAAVPLAIERTYRDVAMTLRIMGKIVTGLVSTRNLSGPLTIAQVAGASAEYGFEYFVSVLAMLSVGLAVLNLLPIPVLDGGHIVYAAAELVRGRPLPERVQLMGLQIGMFFVASLMILALYNDFARLLPSAMN